MLYHIQVVNKTSGQATCCQLKTASQQAFVCPRLNVGDELEIVLEETECFNRAVLAEFVVPGPCEQEDKNKCLTMKRIGNNEFELIVEYTRPRINSRNKKDLEWKLNQYALHLKSTPPILQDVVQYMRAVKVLDDVKAVKEDANRALEDALAEEQRLMLAMLDAKHAVTERRKELDEATRLYEREKENIGIYGPLAKLPMLM